MLISMSSQGQPFKDLYNLPNKRKKYSSNIEEDAAFVLHGLIQSSSSYPNPEKKLEGPITLSKLPSSSHIKDDPIVKEKLFEGVSNTFSNNFSSSSFPPHKFLPYNTQFNLPLVGNFHSNSQYITYGSPRQVLTRHSLVNMSTPPPICKTPHPSQISLGKSNLQTGSLTSISSRKGHSKRNKSFYKEVKDILEGDLTKNMGFINEIFFLIDPKLHVGPINRDGTFEKRVRLHFIEWKELKTSDGIFWLCWGTLLDEYGYPIFRETGGIYRIPGNQSMLFKYNKNIQGWYIATDEQKQSFQLQASYIKEALESKWKCGTILGARNIIKQLDIDSNKFSLKSKFDVANIVSRFWDKCMFKQNVIELNDENCEIIKKVIKTKCDNELLRLIFVYTNVCDNEQKLSKDSFELAIRRFGSIDVLYNNIVNLINLRCFNGNMDSDGAREFLEEQIMGSYIIRYSQKYPEAFCIAFKDDQNHIIQYNNVRFSPPNGLEVDGERFNSWDDIIDKLKSDLKYPQLQTYYSVIMEKILDRLRH